jgi:Lar family restriction alleviation protein
MKNTEELKPCPFCGSNKITVDLFCVTWCVCCHLCGLQFNRGEPVKKNIIQAWNTRAPIPQQPQGEIPVDIIWKVLGNVYSGKRANELIELMQRELSPMR